MKTEAMQQPAYPPLQVAETAPKEESGLRIIHKQNTMNSLAAPPANDTVQCESDRDPSWFASYE